MAFLIAASIIGLYLWTFFAETSGLGKSLNINKLAFGLAGITAMFCLISYIWPPKKNIFLITLIIYLLVTSMTAILVIANGLPSPFIAFWILESIFAGVFGLWGSLPILISTGIFIASRYVNNSLTLEMMLLITFGGLIPLIAGLVIWHSKSSKDESSSDNKAYRNLANELSEVASKSEVVINAIGDGVIAIDSKGIIQLINPAAQRIIGWGKQDALALNYKSILQLVNQENKELDAANDPIQQVLNINQQIRTNNLTLITNSGKKIIISLVVSPVGDIGAGVIAVFHDITNEKAEEREQAEFISTASHEMRTPVASIEGYLGLALNPQTAQVDDRARDFILKAHASAEHLGRLFQDLLDVSKAEDGRLSNNPKVVNIITFVHDIVQGLEQKAANKGLSLVYEPIPDDNEEKRVAPIYSVNLDNDHIREIVNNLVDNAIKYTPKGEIVVNITGDNDRVVISVKDSGIGIPVEDMPHLFQKFYRVDNKDTREIGGTGLGLYLCRRLAEIMGGRIWAESVRNSGSTFYVELPRISSQEATDLITEQETLVKKEEVSPIAAESVQPVVQTAQPIIAAKTPTQDIKPVQPVPRSGSLTPEQIAAYVAQQRILAQQRAATMPQQPQAPRQPQPQIQAPNNNRPQSISIPVRDVTVK